MGLETEKSKIRAPPSGKVLLAVSYYGRKSKMEKREENGELN